MDEEFLTFDDVLIVPTYSDIESRQEIDTSQKFLEHTLKLPVLSANMDFVTGPEMAIAMWKLGGLGILHRFWSSEEEHIAAIDKVHSAEVPVWLSIGIREPKKTLDFLKAVTSDYNIVGVCIDVAHGHHKKVADMIEFIKGSVNESIYRLQVIAGNVATIDGVTFIHDSGADAAKIGIGAGSVCTTRTVAGVGIPQFSAIMECATIKEPYPDFTVIADGGIRSSGDIAKALAAGADVVMIGNMLSGTDEAPGELIEQGGVFVPGVHEKPVATTKYKRYRGQASFGMNNDRYVKEGIEGIVPYKGPVEPIIHQIKAGLQSSMSYVGARNLTDFKESSRFVQVSSHTLMENSTRVREM